MNNQTIYWLWIQQAIGIASHKLTSIVESYTFAEDFYRADIEEKLRVAEFSPSECARLRNTSLEQCRAVMMRCRKLGIGIISYGDPDYPPRLREIPSPPAVLFIRGNAAVLSKPIMIAVVGTRTPTPGGKKITFEISYDLGKAGAVVVSGGARGIDTQAHIGALQSGGSTVCVLGCGHEYEYLKQYDYIKKEIIGHGAIVTEYPPDFPPSKITFPQRNRIISGLSNGVAVVEAGERSGSLITVGCALDQGRDVFSVPGSATNAYALGTNKLIKEGAKPVTQADEILCEYTAVTELVTARSEQQESPEIAFVPEENKLSSLNINVIDKFEFSDYIDRTLDRNPPGSNRLEGYLEISESLSDNENERSDGESDQKSAKAAAKAAGRGGKDAKKASSVTREPQQSKTVKNTAKEENDTSGKEAPDDVSEDAKKFYRALENGALHIDVIADKTGLTVSAVHAAATELEMSDLVESLPGRLYKIK